MPDGDGVIEVFLTQDEDTKMAIDLQDGVGQALLNQAVQNHQVLMNETIGNIQNANAIVRAVANKKLDEVGTLEAQASRAVTVTPIGAPTTSAGTSQAGG